MSTSLTASDASAAAASSTDSLDIDDNTDNKDATIETILGRCHTNSRNEDRLKQASEHAVQLIQTYAAMDPLAEQSPWKHPQQILDQLKMARNAIQEAWIDYQKQQLEMEQQNDNDDGNNKKVLLSDEEFRVLYLDMITDAFGDVLEEMRQQQTTTSSTGGDDEMDVEVLVDCLQSGMELLEEGDRTQQYLDSMTELPNWEEEEKHIPVHQQMQETMGLRPTATTAVSLLSSSET
ncbi:hypothetical protein IV203_027987 [Nitzschia inconspicua]|uniref:Uncharacterized protein n=1 Tax=Nitzschia inconspicua TaxID=303405 RepID=A0A9K3Q4D0_9STRA|nr:hypothetical protein IV203_027987 [Nitzschia inconspicua]